ncbi:MAG: DUF1761 domain-containing protein [Candidatus Yanofskybacteria bacterium]|nr:DUF1761 domain-containing protein [Candidatus Yanofskybacteria bacterium]
MPEVSINIWAVVVSALSQMVLGFLWYGPLFGKTWMRLSNVSQTDIDRSKTRGMNMLYFLALVGSFVMAYVLAHFIDYAGATTIGGGMQAGFWSWLGFIAPVTLGGVLWEGKSVKFWMLSNAYQLISLLIMGAILASWI